MGDALGTCKEIQRDFSFTSWKKFGRGKGLAKKDLPNMIMMMVNWS